MSVETEADRQLKIAAQGVDQALKALGQINVIHCDGHDEYEESFRDKLRESMFELMKCADVLENYL